VEAGASAVVGGPDADVALGGPYSPVVAGLVGRAALETAKLQIDRKTGKSRQRGEKEEKENKKTRKQEEQKNR